MGRWILIRFSIQRLVVIMAISWRDFAADNPIDVLIKIDLPRVLFQSIFFALITSAFEPENATFAITGSVGFVIAQRMLIGGAGIVAQDNWQETVSLLRQRISNPIVLILFRLLPLCALSLVYAALSFFVLCVLFGQWSMLMAFFLILPYYVLMAISCGMAGLCLGAWDLPQGGDVLLNNAITYIIVSLGGYLIRSQNIPIIDLTSLLLPGGPALHSIRGTLGGSDVGYTAFVEILIIFSLLLLAIILHNARFSFAAKTGKL